MLRTRASRRRAHRLHRLVLQLESLEQRQVLDSTVVFNELMYNPAGAIDDQLEWIELYNQLSVDMDISDWELRGGVDYKFPDGTIVPGRGHLLVAANPTEFQRATGQSALGPWTGQLNNAGETLSLYNNDDRRMNEIQFNDDGDWPVGPDGTGLTLAKQLRNANSEDAENWTFSEQVGGTPGSPNFVEAAQVRTTPLLTSPSPVRAWVPTSDGLGLSWTASAFDDAAWLAGTGGVGIDSRDDYNPYFGLDLDAPPNGQPATPMINVNTSVYLRFPFQLTADELNFDSLQLKMRYDDGFVAYLNGTEIASKRAPGRGGNTDPLTWNSSSISSNNDQNAITFETIRVSNAANLLLAGTNVLAIHGLNRSLTDSDALFDAELTGVTAILPPAPSTLQFNEVAAATAGFFLEIRNQGPVAVNLGDYSIRSDNPALAVFQLPQQSLEANQYLSISAQQLGGVPQSGDHFLLQRADQFVADAVEVTNRLTGRAAERAGAWQYPSQATPGAANAFQLSNDVVINEIMYNPTPELGIADIPPTYSSNLVVPMTSDRWRFNAKGASLPTGWAQQTFPANGQDWLPGQGLIGFETSDLGVPLNTQVLRPSENNPRFFTYYFQTDFTVTAGQLADADRFTLSHMIDAGAVFYLNGQEIVRFNMPSGTVDALTPAVATVNNAIKLGPVTIPLSKLQEGLNTFSAELHLRTNGSNDVVFGAELSLDTEVTPLVPGRPYRERDEMEWIELHNRSDAAVNISGWNLASAIDYTLPSGTVLGPQQYLVIAKNPAAFATVYPNVPALGGYDGSLSNHDEEIRLIDAFDNLADTVHYFEGGIWPALPDGGGSSLELVDPFADNSRGGVWSASDESAKSQWITHTFSGVSLRDVFNSNALFNEFIFGLLDAGEFLIDDIVVLKEPNAQARQLIQNGTFESDAVGAAPAKWRLIGNHSGTVEIDPTNPSNKVLHVISTGAQAHVHDHAETTFINNEDLVDGLEYSLSFRAKWLSGNSQLNSRLWFNRLPSTAKLDVPLQVGTPGARNQQATSNAGPTFSEFGHQPAVPAIDQPVTVTVRAADPAGVAQVTLRWRPDRGSWTNVPMTLAADGTYQGTIPPQSSGRVVQFYVEATDAQGAQATFPAGGEDSRALYQVDDGNGPSSPIDTYRLVIMQAESDRLYAQVNRMSNWTLPMTLIHNDTAYYNIGLRLTGSRWIRPNSGYKIDLNQDQPYLGVHDTIRLDINGLAEIVMKQMLNRAGGNQASNYDDLGFVVSPRSDHSHEAIVQLARYENIFLDEQFVNGTDGTKWELDDVTVPTGPQGGIEGLKADTAVYEQADIGVSTAIVSQQGSNPEFYRGHLLIKSSRARDDYQTIARFAQAIHQDGDALFVASNEVMDVDLWMRHYANQSYFGNWDTYGFRRPKNLRIYNRPEDNKMIPLFWDCDLCNFSETIKTTREATSRLDEIRDIPHNLRLYWGHMYDLMQRSFNPEYVARWAAHYGFMANNQIWGGDETFATITASTATRNTRAMTDMLRDIPRVDFQITTNNGDPIAVDTPTIMLTGKGWVDVRQIRLSGSDVPLDAFWPEKDSWQLELALTGGAQVLTLEAWDYEGRLIGSDAITVTTTLPNPVLDSLRITEIQYNPTDPSAAELAAGFNDNDDFEYIELTNIGDTTVSLAGVQFVRSGADQQGVAFDFDGADTLSLAPGAFVLVVDDIAATRFRYGASTPIAGQWTGSLGNSTELITLITNGTTLHAFAYQDNWQPTTDGLGRSLQIVNAEHPDRSSWALSASWRPSFVNLGTPGAREPVVGDANHDGVFGSGDLVQLFQRGEYEDTISGNSTFEDGDFDGNGDFTTQDFVWAFQYGWYDGLVNARPGTHADDRHVRDRQPLASPETGGPRRGNLASHEQLRRRGWGLPTDPVDAVFAQLPTRSSHPAERAETADERLRTRSSGANPLESSDV